MFACNTGQKENCVIGSLLGYVDAKMWMIKFSTEYFKKNIKKIYWPMKLYFTYVNYTTYMDIHTYMIFCVKMPLQSQNYNY